MARRVHDKTLDSRDARRRLKIRGKPYYRAIERRLHLATGASVTGRRERGSRATMLAISNMRSSASAPPTT